MQKIITGIVVALVLIVVGYFVVSNDMVGDQMAVNDPDSGSYNYKCDNWINFTMTPSKDLKTLTIVPTDEALDIPEVVLSKVASASGSRYEGDDMVLNGYGETVQIGTSNSASNCTPITSENRTAFNFGE